MEKDSDSTVTSIDENTENFCDNPTRDILAEGLVSLFKPTIDQVDERVRATIAAQTELSTQLDSLSKKLKEIEDIQSAIPDFNEKVKKLINVKHKVTVITNVLQASQDRLNEIHRLIDKEQLRRKSLLESDTSPSA